MECLVRQGLQFEFDGNIVDAFCVRCGGSLGAQFGSRGIGKTDAVGVKIGENKMEILIIVFIDKINSVRWEIERRWRYGGETWGLGVNCFGFRYRVQIYSLIRPLSIGKGNYYRGRIQRSPRCFSKHTVLEQIRLHRNPLLEK